MGIFRAVSSAVRETAQVQWRELFVCSALPDEVLLTRGYKQISGRSANTDRNDDTITNGSIIAIADGQAAVVVSGGKVVACCAEPGEFVYHDPNHTSAVKAFFRETARRISFGGSAPSSHGVQRVYYVNTKESMSNRFSGVLPLNYDLAGRGELSGRVRCSGVFSYRIVDPERFYKRITGNVKGSFTRADLSAYLSAELLRSLGGAVSRAARGGVRPVELAGRSEVLGEEAGQELRARWMEDHGLELVSLAVDSLELPEQKTLLHADYAAALAGDPIREPAPSERTALSPKPGPWICVCGTRAERKFCPNCGRPRPD